MESFNNNKWFGIINQKSECALDHYFGRIDEQGIKAQNGDYLHINHQWKFADVGEGFVAIINQKTGGTLDHWFEKPGVGNIRANGDHVLLDHPNHQWNIIPTEKGNNYFHIINRKSGQPLAQVGGGIQSWEGKGDETKWSLIQVYTQKVFKTQDIQNKKHLSNSEHQPTENSLFESEPYETETLGYTTPTEDLIVGIVNKFTKMALDHFYQKPGADGIQALNDDITHINHQWILQNKG